MTTALYAVTFDCTDADRLARFWSASWDETSIPGPLASRGNGTGQ